jgi:hypothetical protein
MLVKEGHILVQVQPDQKEKTIVEGSELHTGRRYSENFREKNAVLCEVIQGLGEIKAGMWLVTNYHYFDEASPFALTDNTYAIPLDDEIYAIINSVGAPRPFGNNIFVELIPKKSIISIPDELKSYYEDRGIVKKGNVPHGSFILFLYKSNLKMHYFWEGVERTFIKVHKDEIFGFVEKV